jgi:dTDP-4-amino-4,6-dideoxygalactose transaminase
MTELQGAVALAQLDRVEEVVRDRQCTATQFLSESADIPGVAAQVVPPTAQSVFWKVTLRLDPAQTGADVREVGAYLKSEFGVVCAPRYVQKPAFECEIFREKRTFGASQWPLRHVKSPDPAHFEGTYDALAHMLVLPWNENYGAEHVRYVVDSLRASVAHFQA